MTVCWCSLAGTAACQHCPQNPFATDVWTNNPVTVDHIEAKPFGNGFDVCPVCGKPNTIGKPQTSADRIRAMTDEELAEIMVGDCPPNYPHGDCREYEKYDGNLDCCKCWLDWLKSPVEVET